MRCHGIIGRPSACDLWKTYLEEGRGQEVRQREHEGRMMMWTVSSYL
jgi:hypothetical protein